MTSLTELLFSSCSALLFPVIIALLFFLAWTAVLLGGFLREYLARSSARNALTVCLAQAKQGGAQKEIWERMSVSRAGVLAAFHSRVESGASNATVLMHTVSELEHDIAGGMAHLSLLTRVGPMLGLMGTLIPLGPALTGLASGDVKMMAQNLVVAFTTTVIGVLIGSLAYGIGLVRKAWYARDLSDLEFICQRLALQEVHS